MFLLKRITKYRKWIISAFLLLFFWWTQSALWALPRVSDYFLHLQYGDKYYLRPWGTKAEVSELVKRNLNNLVYLPSGDFNYGYYDVDIIGYDGSLYEDRLAPFYSDLSENKVSMDNFYISKFEITNRDIDVYLGSIRLDIPIFESHSGYGYDSWRKVERRSLFWGVRPPESFADWIWRMMTEPYGQFYEFYQERMNDPNTDFGYKVDWLSHWGDLPAVMPWDVMQGYCQWVGQQAGIEMGLPTDIQWEYAARVGGHATLVGTDTGELTMGVNIPEFSQEISEERGPLLTHRVDAFSPSPWGLHEMHGNVGEWVDSEAKDLTTYAFRFYDDEGHKGADHKIARIATIGSSPEDSMIARLAFIEHHSIGLFSDEGLHFERPPVSGGARCVANVSEPPQVTGFGEVAGEVPSWYPRILSLEGF